MLPNPPTEIPGSARVYICSLNTRLCHNEPCRRKLLSSSIVGSGLNMFYVESYPLLDPRPNDSCHLISIQLNYWLRSLNPSTSADYNDMHKVTLWRRNLQQGIHKMGCNPNLERLHCFIVFNQSSIASFIAALTRRRSLYTGLKSVV